MQNTIIIHQLAQEAFYTPDWEINYLLLGTFNPSGGEKVNYFYGRPKNQTWKVLSKIFCVELNPSNFDDFLGKLKDHKIACMDMIHSVSAPHHLIPKITGQGYSDQIIINNTVKREYNTDEIKKVIKQNNEIKVFSTWGNGSSLKDWTTEINKIVNIIPLVSPSLVARVPAGQNKSEYILKDWKQKISHNC